jgi:hypothetical protein
MQIHILYIEGCPNLPLAFQRVNEAVTSLAVDVEVEAMRISSDEIFAGSPTVLVDGEDVCAPSASRIMGASCRTYATAQGIEGAPPVEAIKAAIGAALKRHSRAV